MNKVLYLFIIVVLASCAPTRHVIPLGRKERAVSVSVGGPIVTDNQTTMPEPNVNITYAYGKNKRLTYFAGAHLTGAVNGYYGLELGALREWWYDEKTNLGFSTNFVANMFTDKKNFGFDFFPQFDMNLYWHFHGDPHYYCDCPSDGKYMKYLYAGIGSWYKVITSNTWEPPLHEDVIIAPHIGFNYGGKHWKLNTEIKWIQPWADNTKSDPEIWNPVSDYGTYGAFLSYYRLF